MSSNSLNHASTHGRRFDLKIFEKNIHRLLCQELKSVGLTNTPWNDILRATNDPGIAGPILQRIEDDCVKYEHVISQSVNRIESVIHRVSSRMLRHAENAKDSFTVNVDVLPVWIAFLRGEKGFVTSAGMISLASRTQSEFTAYLALVACVNMCCRDQQDCKVADIFSVGAVYCPYEGTKSELVRRVVKDAAIAIVVM
ncbi:hypothetical protein NPX13_g5849 [Xylaria arbuscula]|uniref:Uncharacterized protein n=1 Tax=Xylaria arbuscula TaxID=114810 RepID=A0A9W8NE14_9PEZI|nr:hypothetical protein NPX13_g5849 [Xylaria arbuscula]